MGHTSSSSRGCVTLDCVRTSAAARQQTHPAAQHQEVLPALQVGSRQYSSVFVICFIKLYIVCSLFTTLFLLHFSMATNCPKCEEPSSSTYYCYRRRSVKRSAADSDRERGGPPPPALLPAPSLLHRINLFVTSSEFLLSYTNICTALQSKHG